MIFTLRGQSRLLFSVSPAGTESFYAIRWRASAGKKQLVRLDKTFFSEIVVARCVARHDKFLINFLPLSVLFVLLARHHLTVSRAFLRNLVESFDDINFRKKTALANHREARTSFSTRFRKTSNCDLKS